VNGMKVSIRRALGVVPLIAALCLPASATAEFGIESSYHGQLGRGSGSGMLEKWCALPNFSIEQQGGIEGWTRQSCNDCHVGAAWNPEKPWGNCFQCHSEEDFVTVEADACLACHVKDTAKRGDVFTAELDVHIAVGLRCFDCHAMANETPADHQFLKGTAIDTTEPTMEGTLSCTAFCHAPAPHAGSKDSDRLNRHTVRVACETCHTGQRPAPALAEHKWYDNSGPGAAGDYALPILGYTERREAPGARIYPFNVVSVSWFVKTPTSDFDDVIIVPEVKAADADRNGTITVAEMRAVYPEATLLTRDMNFSISHSVTPKEQAFNCSDCHGAGC